MDKLEAKVLTLGESTVGKTSILNRLIDNKISKNNLSTIGIDFKIKKITIGKVTIELKIWDTAGQERYRNITKQYFKGAEGILLIFDLTNRETFEKIYQWVEQLNNNITTNNISIVLIGNKKDLPDREISFEEGTNRAKELNVEYFETSAKTGENINEVFINLSTKILEKKGIMVDRSQSIEINKKQFIHKTNQKYCC